MHLAWDADRDQSARQILLAKGQVLASVAKGYGNWAVEMATELGIGFCAV